MLRLYIIILQKNENRVAIILKFFFLFIRFIRTICHWKGVIKADIFIYCVDIVRKVLLSFIIIFVFHLNGQNYLKLFKKKLFLTLKIKV